MFNDLLERLGHESRVAVDTEFHREETYYPHVGLVQLAWSEGLALVDPTKVDFEPFGSILESDVLIVMHAAGQDLEVFDWVCGTAPVHLFDTQVGARFLGMSMPSLSTLSERLLGIQIPKDDRLTDWFARPLSGSQIEYAAADVVHLLTLHDHITKELLERNRMQWMKEECQFLLTLDRGPRDPLFAWEGVKEIRRLKGPGFERACALAAWREREAERHDIPARSVLPDVSLLAIAKENPEDERTLRKIPVLDSRHLRNGVSDSLLAAMRETQPVKNANSRVRSSVRRSSAQGSILSLISAWIGQLAKDLELDPALLATRADIEAFIRGDSNIRLKKGWRHDLLGEGLVGLLEGRVSLSLDKEGGLVAESHKKD